MRRNHHHPTTAIVLIISLTGTACGSSEESSDGASFDDSVTAVDPTVTPAEPKPDEPEPDEPEPESSEASSPEPAGSSSTSTGESTEPTPCDTSALQLIDDQGYIVSAEGAVLTPDPTTADGTALGLGTDELRPTGDCAVVGETTFWEVTVGTDRGFVDASLVALQPEAFDDALIDKSTLSVASEDLASAAAGEAPDLCDPADPQYATIPEGEAAPVAPALGGEAAYGAFYLNAANQTFEVTVESFGPDADARAQEFFEHAVCLELVGGDPFTPQAEDAANADALGDIVNEIESQGISVDDDDLNALGAQIDSRENATGPDGLQPAVPETASEQSVRIITIEPITLDIDGTDVGPEASNLTGYFLIDPTIGYNGSDYYSVRHSQYVSGYGLSQRGTLALWIYTSAAKLLKSTAASPGNYTASLTAWAPSSGAFLLATAYKSSVTYTLWGSWRSESYNK